MHEPDQSALLAIAQHFQLAGEVTAAAPLGAGNVNDTYLVQTTLAQTGAVARNKFVMQRINQQVFKRPELIMLNLRTFSEHVQQRLDQERGNSTRRWEVPSVTPTHAGEDFFVDDAGEFWRIIDFVDASHTFGAIQSRAHAREAGYALGRFHSLLSDLDPARLHDTLEGFHITPQYLANYDTVRQKSQAALDHADVVHGLRFVEARREWASVLEEAVAAGKLTRRAIHGDPKVDNIMLDNTTKQAVSIVDLDTVKPGLVHYDIGDCLRSCCNRLGEETQQIDAVTFDTALCKVILEGYLSEARHFFSPADYAYVYDCVRLIAFELGLRFFSDYLAGNVYFKVKDEQHNLRRALVQFKLCESIEAQEAEIQSIIRAVS
ncbi:MAG: phosphotransferase [Caldilineaceae bacterium]|nr:phosphotransferase [Caldilineaceae bacterium]